MNPKVDFYFNKDTQWQDAYKKLRTLILECGLTEDLKWGVPCYSLNKKNIVLIHGFKDYCAILFHKGVLLADTENILIQQTENVQSARQIRFKSLNDITEMEKVIKTYVFEAIEVEKAGLKVEFKQTTQFEMPVELRAAFDQNPKLKTAFEALTPGRQRGYILHFSQAKQSKTRMARIEKFTPKIMDGLGFNDR